MRIFPDYSIGPIIGLTWLKIQITPLKKNGESVYTRTDFASVPLRDCMSLQLLETCLPKVEILSYNLHKGTTSNAEHIRTENYILKELMFFSLRNLRKRVYKGDLIIQ